MYSSLLPSGSHLPAAPAASISSARWNSFYRFGAKVRQLRHVFREGFGIVIHHGRLTSCRCHQGAWPLLQVRLRLPGIPALLKLRFRLLERCHPISPCHRAVDGHRPEPAQIVGTATGLVDAADLPLASEDRVNPAGPCRSRSRGRSGAWSVAFRTALSFPNKWLARSNKSFGEHEATKDLQDPLKMEAALGRSRV
jgi:hypothetical protein